MTPERKQFERYVQEYRSSLWAALDTSTHDPRWLGYKSEMDQLWHVWQAARRAA